MKNYIKIWSFNIIGLVLVIFLSLITFFSGNGRYPSLIDFFLLSYFIGKENFSILVLSIAGSLIATTIYYEINDKDFTMYRLFKDILTGIVFSYIIVWILCFVAWTLLSILNIV